MLTYRRLAPLRKILNDPLLCGSSHSCYFLYLSFDHHDGTHCTSWISYTENIPLIFLTASWMFLLLLSENCKFCVYMSVIHLICRFIQGHLEYVCYFFISPIVFCKRKNVILVGHVSHFFSLAFKHASLDILIL